MQCNIIWRTPGGKQCHGYLAARYGGEEFAVILPNTALTGALALAETIRKTIASKRVMIRGSNQELGGITLSLGVARFDPEDTAETLLRRAGKALYAAKEQGRNRVVSGEHPATRSAA